MNITNEKDKKPKLIFNVLVSIFAFIIFMGQEKVVRETTIFDELMIETLAPVQESINNVRLNISDFFSHYIFNISASKENLELKTKNKDLEERLIELAEIKKENLRIKKLFHYAQDENYTKNLARVISWDASSDVRVIRINKGAKSGITLQSPVVTAGGLVGYVYRLTDHFADVLTILDQKNKIDVIVSRTRSHGILEGALFNKCDLKYIPQEANITLGDLVLTSGFGNIYPKGLVVGRISKIEKESYGMTQDIDVVPSVDFTKLEEVLVLTATKVHAQEQKALDSLDEGESK